MSSRPPVDSIDWMREHWTQSEAPSASQACAMVSLLRTTALVTEELDRQLKAQKLNRTGYLVLITLQMSDDCTRPLGQLSKALLVHPTTVTQLIDQLEKAKLVVRRPHPTDRRTVLAKLTAKGLTAVRQTNEALAAVGFGLPGIHDAMADRITEDLKAVRAALRDLG